MLRIQIQTTGTREATIRIRGLEDAAGDMRPAFVNVATWFYDLERRRFASRGFGTWQVLKRRTVARKGGEGRMMRRTDALYNSLTRPEARGSIRSVRSDGIEVGTRIPYAKYHQRSKGGGRKLISLRESDRRRVRTIIVDHFTGAIS